MKKSERLARENAELRKRIELLEATVQRLVTAPAFVPYPVNVGPYVPAQPIQVTPWLQIDQTPPQVAPISPAPGIVWPSPYYTTCSTASGGVPPDTTGCVQYALASS